MEPLDAVADCREILDALKWHCDQPPDLFSIKRCWDRDALKCQRFFIEVVSEENRGLFSPSRPCRCICHGGQSA